MSESERRITLLGRVAIGPNGDTPAVPASRGRRAELVFAYLVAEHRRLVTHDELADALWPDRLPDTWEAALRGVLSEVRRYLSEGGLDPTEVLTSAHRGHRLLLPPEVTVDLDDARDSLAAARSHFADGSAPVAARYAARASSLARQPFLPNHDGEWIDGIRRELASINARAIELEARAHQTGGDLAAAAIAAERLVQAEPFNETAHQLRIRILGQAGDRSGAIKAFEHCRDVLAAELGVAPSDETTATYRAAAEHGSPASSPTPVPRPPSGADHTNDLSVLVVEDHDFQRRTAVMLLRNLGISTVAESANGVDALALLQTSVPPDVIVCDIDMPGMDGVEFIHHVAENELAGAVIIASALDAKVIDAVRAVSEGCGLQVLGAVEKPLTARRLGELLATYRRRWRRSPPNSTDLVAPVTAVDARTAIGDGRITTHLQPVVDVSTGRICAAESQPRWNEPGTGWVPPALFVPVLQRERLLGELFERALATACANLREFSAMGLDLGITVEFAPDGVSDADLAVKAAEVVRTNDVDPSRVSLALDERALRTAPGTALDLLTRVRVKGFGVALCNFGSGRLGADLLGALPITEVYLAPFLVSSASAEPQRVRALEDAVQTGRRLDVSIVGDGCDSEHDLRLLLELGCDRIAGEYIADAMPGNELPGWVASWDPDRLVVGG